MNKELTEKQENIYKYIVQNIRDTGFPPTVREIGSNFGITAKGAYDHLKAIEKKGFIHCSEHKSRAIEIMKHLDNAEATTSENDIRVPIVGTIAAGQPLLAEENISDHLTISKTITGKGTFFALKVKGDSMIDEGIFDGDYAIIRQQPSAENGAIIAALVGNEATLKILKKLSTGIELQPANKNYKPITSKDVSVLGLLKAIVRKY